MKAEHKALIELSIKRSPHYNKRNEDLFELFCAEIYDKIKDTLLILGDKIPPQTYLDKVTQKVISQVLKEQKRLTSKVFDNDAPIENLISFNINEKGDLVFNIPYPCSEREKLSVIHEQLRLIINNLYRFNENEPEKQYLKLFELRYNQNLKLCEIAHRLNISESQTSQRLFELLAKLNDF